MPGLGGSPFVITADTPLPPETAWHRLTDWPAHGRAVPLTTVTGPARTAAGSLVVARTAVGRFGFDDPMEVVAWEPPRFCRLEKRGRVVRGWAELAVEALPDRRSRVTWREVAVPAGLPGFASGLAARTGRLVFARVLRHLLSDT
jgi:hypothetical protein